MAVQKPVREVVSITINLGDDTPASVSAALTELIKSLTKSTDITFSGIAMSTVTPTWDYSDLINFLIANGASLPAARNHATRAMEQLICHLTSSKLTVFICPHCQKRHGVCRCSSMGYTSDLYETPCWFYLDYGKAWLVDKAAFLELTDADFTRLSKQSTSRLKAFAESLRQEQP